MILTDIRLVYLLFFGAVGTSISYQTLFLEQRGLDDIQIGALQVAQGVAVFFAPLISAHFADRHSSSRTSLISCFTALALAHGLLYFSHGFNALFISSFLLSLSYTPIFSLLDSSALSWIADKPHLSFTLLRIWGSIGFLLPALLLFPFLRGGDAEMSVTVCYGGLASVTGAIAAWFIIPKSRMIDASVSALPSIGALRALLQPALRGFAVSRFLTQISIWIWYPFFPLYLRHQGYDTSWIGPILNIGVVAEILWAFGVRHYDKSAGGRLISVVAAGSMAFRMLLLTALPSLETILFAQLLHAPYIWAMFFRGTVYISSHVEERYRTSFLALNGILFHGITRALGGPLGGAISEAATLRGIDGLSAALFVGGIISSIGVLVAVFGINEEPKEPTLGACATNNSSCVRH